MTPDAPAPRARLTSVRAGTTPPRPAPLSIAEAAQRIADEAPPPTPWQCARLAQILGKALASGRPDDVAA